MSDDGPAEKRNGFERWVASLKLGTPLRPSSAPPGAESDERPLTLDEQATLINRIPKEVIYKLRERDSNRAMPKTDDSTAVFTPPPELLARAKRFQAPPKPERSSPTSSSSPISARPTDPSNLPTTRPPPPDALSIPRVPGGLSAAEAAAFASLNSEEEATTYFKPDISEFPPSVPPALQGDVSRPGDIQWIDGLPSEPSAALGRAPLPSGASQGSIAPAERRIRWVAVFVAIILLAGIFALSRMQ